MRSSHGHILRRAALFMLLALASLTRGYGLAVEEELKPLVMEAPSVWAKSIEPRLWIGYKDNVLLSNSNIVQSPFLAGGLDFSLFSLPQHGWEWLFLSSIEYTRYSGAQQADDEAFAFLEGQVTKAVREHWKLGLGVDYVYFNQVFDLSTLEDVAQAVPVQSHGVTVHPSIAADFGTGYSAQLELPATRELFDAYIDDYWEWGPKLTLARAFGRQTDISFTYQFGDRAHDTREAKDEEGNVLPGQRLRFFQHDLGVVWRQYWGADRNWRTTTKLSVQRNDDNGGGYYEYLRPQLSLQLRYQARRWEARAEARVSHYWYDHQRVEGPESALREKTYLRLNLRGERSVGKSCKLFAQYEHERALSNLETDAYNVNTVFAGVQWEF